MIIVNDSLCGCMHTTEPLSYPSGDLTPYGKRWIEAMAFHYLQEPVCAAIADRYRPLMSLKARPENFLWEIDKPTS